MSFNEVYAPAAGIVAGAAYQAGYGQFLQHQQELQQQQAMQNQQIAAQQQMAQFQAQQDAQHQFAAANNADVMANHDAQRQSAQMQQHANLQLGAQNDEQAFRAQEADQQRQFQQQQMGAQQKFQQQRDQFGVDQKAIQNSPMLKQLQEISAGEAMVHANEGGKFEPWEKQAYLDSYANKRKALMSQMQQQTPDQKKQALQQDWETSSVPMPDGSRVFKDPKTGGWKQINPSDVNKSPAALQAAAQAKQADLQAKAQAAAMQAQMAIASKKLDFIAKITGSPKGKDAENNDIYHTADDAEAMFNKIMPAHATPGGPNAPMPKAPVAGGGAVSISPEVKRQMQDNGQSHVVKVQSPQQLQMFRPGTVFMTPDGVARVYDPRALQQMSDQGGGGGARTMEFRPGEDTGSPETSEFRTGEHDQGDDSLMQMAGESMGAAPGGFGGTDEGE